MAGSKSPARAKASFHVGAVSLMPADNNHGFRTDTIALLKAQRNGMYRWPGGNFLSAHEWRDAIGDIDKRPPKWDPVWNALQPNDVGTDEFLFMADLLGVDSFLSVNAGFGDARSAADLVEYVTGSINTPMGKLRAANGHPAPYKVKWWGVGNEMWGDFQFGHMALNQFVFKHNLFGEAMRKVDPNILLVGDGNTPRMSDIGTDNDWSGGMLTHCLPYIDVMSEHYYVYETGQQSNAAQKKAPPPPVEESVIDAVHRTANSVRSKVEVYEEYYKRMPAAESQESADRAGRVGVFAPSREHEADPGQRSGLPRNVPPYGHDPDGRPHHGDLATRLQHERCHAQRHRPAVQALSRSFRHGAG